MKIQSLLIWLETHWVVPAYGGWVLGGLVLFFFGAATNTMAGWLYVMSGVMLALLIIAASLPPQIVRSLVIERQPIFPVMAGEVMTVRLRVSNNSSTSRELLQVEDALPKVLDEVAIATIERLEPHRSFSWIYHCPVSRRGVYRWHSVYLRTAAPLGLFWCRRDRPAPAKAIVYPSILPLAQCPLLDHLGQETHTQNLSHQHTHLSNEGLTRALRPYRWGDATRLIHWRTSARYGELRVRELEVFTSSPSVILAIDTAMDWNPEYFEQAAIAAISLYTYACQQQMNVTIWTAEHGGVHTQPAVYEVLAAMHPSQGMASAAPIADSVVWLTPSSDRIAQLPATHRWLLWPPDATAPSIARTQPLYSPSTSSSSFPVSTSGLCINPEHDMRSQLSALTTHAAVADTTINPGIA